jgi:hypothetical protein
LNKETVPPVQLTDETIAGKDSVFHQFGLEFPGASAQTFLNARP